MSDLDTYDSIMTEVYGCHRLSPRLYTVCFECQISATKRLRCVNWKAARTLSTSDYSISAPQKLKYGNWRIFSGVISTV